MSAFGEALTTSQPLVEPLSEREFVYEFTPHFTP
jgi:hypothetical protein